LTGQAGDPAAARDLLTALVKRGDPITFQSVQREAGVSHAFLYGNADLRARIEQLRAQARPKPPPPDGAGSDNTVTVTETETATAGPPSSAARGHEADSGPQSQNRPWNRRIRQPGTTRISLR